MSGTTASSAVEYRSITGLSGGKAVVILVGQTAENVIGVLLCRMAAPMKTSTNSTVKGQRQALSNLATGATGIVGVLLLVFQIAFSKKRISPGRTVKLHSRLKTTPLDSTQPRSAPILNLIKTSIIRPTKVVSALERMVLADACMADVIASVDSVPLSFSSLKRFIRIMA